MTQAKVYVVIYTVYHHVHKLAVEVQKGLESTGVATKMFQGKSMTGFAAN
jgi:NAD(P)H dehydrogenase (quinone)